MLDVIIADNQELFHVGMAEVLAAVDDVRIVGQPQSLKQLLRILKNVSPQVLILSANFLPAVSKIQRRLKDRRTALVVLAEDDDPIVYTRWFGARGIFYRSMDGSAMVDAMRQVARGELFVQDRCADRRACSVAHPDAAFSAKIVRTR
jgi:DNA-binding NarL/FixJ family response regulator